MKKRTKKAEAPKEPAKNPRPQNNPKELDYDQLKRLCTLPLRQDDIAFIMDTCVDTLVKHIKARYNMTFSAYMDICRAVFRETILSKQLEVARAGNVAMLIWLGKNYLDQSDKKAEDEDTKKKVDRLNQLAQDLLDFARMRAIEDKGNGGLDDQRPRPSDN